MGIISCAHSRPIGLRHTKLNGRAGLGDAGILAEGKAAGLYMDKVSGLLGGRLSGSGAGGVCLQVNAHLAFGGNHPGHRIISKIRAVNLVRAVLVASVNNDAHVVQRSPSAFLELLHTVSMDGEKRLAAL